MPLADSLFGWLVIFILYVIMGVLAAAGSILISQKMFKGNNERKFYGFFLIAIAGFYAAFVVHFGDSDSWEAELSAIAIFTALGLLGAFNASILALGYLLHGVWDMVHELNQTFGVLMLNSVQLTTVPMLYGVFCLTYDFIMAKYFIGRQKTWETQIV